MYLLNNALKNLGRNKGRNILIALITLVAILAVSVSIVINTAVESIVKEYTSKFGSKVTLYLDAEKARPYDNIQYPSARQQMDFAKSDTLQKTEYICSLSVVLKDCKALDGDAIGGNAIAGIQGADDLSINAKVLASSDPDISEDFVDGTRSIQSGRAFQRRGECIVSEGFAALNGLGVGDKVTVTNTEKDNPMPLTLTICGIYQDHLPEGNSALRHPAFNRGNEIITDMESLMETELFGARGTVNATYFLKDPNLLETFQKEVTEKGLAPYYRATTDEEAYHKIVGPVKGISKIVTIFLTVVLIFGGVILLFLSILSIRERKYEIGVLRAMGMKKLRVITGMVCESLVITCACLVIGLGASAALSQPIADNLLASQIRMAGEQQKSGETLLLTPGKETQDAISALSVQITPEAALQTGALALALVLVSSMAGILYITRYEPMKILSERG